MKKLWTALLLSISAVLVCGPPATQGGGLAASQSRLLMMTARQSDLDLEVQAINQTRLWLSNLTMGLHFRLAELSPGGSPRAERSPLYGKSYALVVGIDEYPSERWPDLRYAVRDAVAMASYLESRGFEVTALYNKEAKARDITIQLRQLARRLETEDRVIYFFAGHGHTEQYNGRQFGFLVPHDGDELSADYLSMAQLREMSRMMGRAKHQLFIIDACYGGLLGVRGAERISVDQPAPGKDSWPFLKKFTSRRARQILTAGGADEIVVDEGPGGHSIFTSHLLRALETGVADENLDGYVTFSELTTYLGPNATSVLQTPAWSVFAEEHEPGGEFVFQLPEEVYPKQLREGEIDTKSMLEVFKLLQKLEADRNGVATLRQQVEELQTHPQRSASIEELQLTLRIVSARLGLLLNSYDILRGELLGLDALDPLGEKSENANASTIEVRIRALQEMDKNLELQVRRLDSQREAVTTELEAMRRVIQKDISETFRLMG